MKDELKCRVQTLLICDIFLEQAEMKASPGSFGMGEIQICSPEFLLILLPRGPTSSSLTSHFPRVRTI